MLLGRPNAPARFDTIRPAVLPCFETPFITGDKFRRIPRAAVGRLAQTIPLGQASQRPVRPSEPTAGRRAVRYRTVRMAAHYYLLNRSPPPENQSQSRRAPFPICEINCPVRRVSPSTLALPPSRPSVCSIIQSNVRLRRISWLCPPPRIASPRPPRALSPVLRLPITASDTDAPATWQPLGVHSNAFFRNRPRTPVPPPSYIHTTTSPIAAHTSH